MNRSNRSFVALQIGQIPGGCSRAQRYPQTLQRQTGNGSEEPTRPVTCLSTIPFFRSPREGLRSGIGDSV